MKLKLTAVLVVVFVFGLVVIPNTISAYSYMYVPYTNWDTCGNTWSPCGNQINQYSYGYNAYTVYPINRYAQSYSYVPNTNRYYSDWSGSRWNNSGWNTNNSVIDTRQVVNQALRNTGVPHTTSFSTPSINFSFSRGGMWGF